MSSHGSQCNMDTTRFTRSLDSAWGRVSVTSNRCVCVCVCVTACVCESSSRHLDNLAAPHPWWYYCLPRSEWGREEGRERAHTTYQTTCRHTEMGKTYLPAGEFLLFPHCCSLALKLYVARRTINWAHEAHVPPPLSRNRERSSWDDDARFRNWRVYSVVGTLKSKS